MQWCNDQGGINGRELRLTEYDAAIQNYQTKMQEACGQESAIVGDGAVQDNLWASTGAAAALIDIAGRGHAGEVRHGRPRRRRGDSGSSSRPPTPPTPTRPAGCRPRRAAPGGLPARGHRLRRLRDPPGPRARLSRPRAARSSGADLATWSGRPTGPPPPPLERLACSGSTSSASWQPALPSSPWPRWGVPAEVTSSRPTTTTRVPLRPPATPPRAPTCAPSTCRLRRPTRTRPPRTTSTWSPRSIWQDRPAGRRASRPGCSSPTPPASATRPATSPAPAFRHRWPGDRVDWRGGPHMSPTRRPTRRRVA